MPIFINVEIALVEGGDDALLVVDHGGMQHHLFDLLAKNEDAALGGIRILSGTRRGRWGGRWRIRRRLGTRGRSGRRLVRGSRLGLRVRQRQRRQEEENQQKNVIPSAHSNPSWRRPSAAAILLA